MMSNLVFSLPLSRLTVSSEQFHLIAITPGQHLNPIASAMGKRRAFFIFPLIVRKLLPL